MFSALLVKEWRERLQIAAFAAGLMTVFAVSFLAFGGDKDLKEVIPAAFLVIFFPFLAVVLGAGAFESEFRDGAWAFLLSRPVRKETIWLAKLAAPAAVLAAFWVLFLGLMATVPGLADVIAGLDRAQLFSFGIRFFPPIWLSSVFFFAVAFALSSLSDRQFSLAFGSLFIGLVLEGLILVTVTWLHEQGLLYRSGRFLEIEVLLLALVLSILAVLAASLITFRRSDFSQPSRKAASLARFSTLFLASAWILAAAWPTIRPRPKERFEALVTGSNGEAVITTTRGVYRYDIARNSLTKILRGDEANHGFTVDEGGRLLFISEGGLTRGPALWTIKTDGSDQFCLAGGGRPRSSGYLWFRGYLRSPDGRQVVYIYETESENLQGHKPALESVRLDGSDRVSLPPLDPRMTEKGARSAYVQLRGWLDPGKTLLLSMTKAGQWSLWTYDLATGTQVELFQTPADAGIESLSENLLLWIPERGKHRTLELYDIVTKERSQILELLDIDGPSRALIGSIAWTETKDKVAFMVRQSDDAWVPAVYLIKERRLVMPEGLELKSDRAARPFLTWLPGGTKLIVSVPQDRALKILDQSLKIERIIPVPESMKRVFQIRPFQKLAFIREGPNALWRLDLDTEKWKRIW